MINPFEMLQVISLLTFIVCFGIISIVMLFGLIIDKKIKKLEEREWT